MSPSAHRMIVPFSLTWHDDADLDGHCPMPLNAAGQGPELDPARVVETVCWCWRGRTCDVVVHSVRDVAVTR